MKTASTALRAAQIALPVMLSALALAGCISLFPKTKPALLYRFGAPVPTAAPAPPATGSFAVRLAPIGFPVAAAADRILTVNGERAAYVSGGRWVTAAETLFEAAVVQTFDTRGGPAHLLARGELAPAALVLKLDVRRFEARYDQGAGTAPTVLVEVFAALDDPADATQHRQKIFIEPVPATDNRMEPIVAAYDQAVGKACAEVADWVNTRGG
jgi:cholesterol transport system auxiliary component